MSNLSPTGPRVAILIAAIALFTGITGNAALMKNQQVNCQNIQSVYTRIRINAVKKERDDIAAAKANVANLDRNARLLGIKVTPELRAQVKKEAVEKIAAAKKGTGKTLLDYAPQSCPLFRF